MTSNQKLWVRLLGGVALVLAMSLFGGTDQLLADGTDCQMQDGTPRDCTPSEEIGACMNNGVDAYDQCRSSGGSWNWVVCTDGWEIDFYSCLALAPIIALLSE